MTLLSLWVFVLEVLAWITLGRWGWHLDKIGLSRWFLTCLIPGAFMLVWGMFLSPKAVVSLPDVLKRFLRFAALAFSALIGAQVWGKSIGMGFLAAVILGAIAEEIVQARGYLKTLPR